MSRSISALSWLVAALPAVLSCGASERVDAADAVKMRSGRNYGTCNPRCPVGETCCNGICSDLKEAGHCGTCERSCGLAAACVDGDCTCLIADHVACPIGDPAVGSVECTNLNEDLNCGQCGKLCLWGDCNNGNCTCPNNTTTCAEDGGIACVDTNTNFRHCGACGAWCKGTSCEGGICGCPQGQTTCAVDVIGPNATPDDTLTYCADTMNDPDNCGTCGNVCPTGACANGFCVPCTDTICATQGGVECTDLASDSENCGWCGHDCPGYSHCALGMCKCDDSHPDACGYGVCTKLSEDPNNCGLCGAVCMPGVACTDGLCDCPTPGLTPQNCGCAECDVHEVCTSTNDGRYCQECEPHQSVCGNECLDLANDRYNCGACGTTCGDDQICGAGTCADCPGGQTRCFNGCRDLQNDRLNCGGCVHICGPDEICQEGNCVAEGTGATTGEPTPSEAGAEDSGAGETDAAAIETAEGSGGSSGGVQVSPAGPAVAEG
jgi:hypothetical protein